MSKAYDSIMRLSNKGYIDNLEDVGEITDAMMNSTLAELTVPSFNTMRVGGNLLHAFYLPNSIPEDVKFGELLNLIRVYCLETNSTEMAAQLVPMLRSLSQSVGKARLFTAIPITSFIGFISDKARSELPLYLYNRICEKSVRHLSFGFDDATTVGDFLDEIGFRMTRWTPGTPIDAFVDYTSNCCETVKMLLVDCLRVGYIDMFKLSELNSRLGKLAENQGCCSKSELIRLNRQYANAFNTKYDYTTDDKIFDSMDPDEFFDEDDFDVEGYED